jgi:hypothetical protein
MLKLATGFVVDRSPGAPTTLPRVDQDETNWCWAACLQLLLQLILRNRLSQCQVAELVLGQNPGECCSGAEPCNFSLRPEEVSDALDDVGLAADFFPTVLSPRSLSLAVAAGPVAIVLTRTASGHMLLAVRMSGLAIVDVLDPWLKVGSVDYQYLVDQHPLGHWSRTWSNVRAS